MRRLYIEIALCLLVWGALVGLVAVARESGKEEACRPHAEQAQRFAAIVAACLNAGHCREASK